MISQANHQQLSSGNKNFSERDIFWMQRALQLAECAANKNEVPVGALLVLEDKIIGEGCNASISLHDPSAHAEILALRAGAEKIGNYRLLNTTLYVTLEPCIMCVGAMVHARINQLIYGALDPKTGAIVSRLKALDLSFLNHHVQHHGGLLAEQSGELLKSFFKERR